MNKGVGAALHRIAAHEGGTEAVEKMVRQPLEVEPRIDFMTGAAVFLFTSRARQAADGETHLSGLILGEWTA